MIIKQTRGDNVFDCINIFLLSCVLIITLYPLLFVVSASISDPTAVLDGEVFLLPKGLTWQAYARVFKNEDIMRGYINTICYTIVGTCVNLIFTITGAYPLSRKTLYGRNIIMILFTFTMYFGGGMIPTYLIIKQLNLVDNFWVMILPGAIGTWNLIVTKTYFQNSIPEELYESANIDGASNMKTLFKIVLPLSLPIIAVQILFYSVGHWNAFFNALIYLTSGEKYPLQMILREILVQNQMESMMDTAQEAVSEQKLLAESIKYSTIIVSSLPVLMIYPFIQKYFVKGVMLGAIKG